MVEDMVDVKILNLGGYVPGVRTKFPIKVAQAYVKAGYVKIIGKIKNKLAPNGDEKGQEDGDEKEPDKDKKGGKK